MPFELCVYRCGRSVLDQHQFCPWGELAKVYLIHQSTHQEYTPARAPKNVFRRKRIRQKCRIEPGTLVGNAQKNALLVRLEYDADLLLAAVAVTVQHCIDGRLAHRHRNVGRLVFRETLPGRKGFRLLLHPVDRVQRGGQCEARMACARFVHAAPFACVRGVAQACSIQAVHNGSVLAHETKVKVPDTHKAPYEWCISAVPCCLSLRAERKTAVSG